ncbi:Hypothetical predicted protein [Paramuricea clavata]|uniref:Uncharacterized protein n=1 Tax=Paramuricea clavata TaxID=317549 RepID=A0A6S7KPF9_PARCT|nr:Hypothetical predicted protein [Paramuricea clavata]CAB4030003.1 Hypothetical predicted protein [Paramuricea clavata]
MTDTKKEVINELYDAALLTTGVVGVSYLAKTVAEKSLGAPMTLEGAAKLAVAVAGRGLFNAVAFAGAGFLFSKLNGQGYKEEVKRHNQALEKLAKSKEKFYESEVKRRNDEARRRAEILDANKDIEETNRALEDLRDYTRLMDNTASQRRPKLEDYYQPSDEMKRYAVLTVGILGVGGAYG